MWAKTKTVKRATLKLLIGVTVHFNVVLNDIYMHAQPVLIKANHLSSASPPHSSQCVVITILLSCWLPLSSTCDKQYAVLLFLFLTYFMYCNVSVASIFLQMTRLSFFLLPGECSTVICNTFSYLLKGPETNSLSLSSACIGHYREELGVQYILTELNYNICDNRK